MAGNVNNAKCRVSFRVITQLPLPTAGFHCIISIYIFTTKQVAHSQNVAGLHVGYKPEIQFRIHVLINCPVMICTHVRSGDLGQTAANRLLHLQQSRSAL